MSILSLHDIPLQVESIATFNDNEDLFPQPVCSRDSLIVHAVDFCGGFKSAFVAGSALHTAALSLPHSPTVTVAGTDSAVFQFLSNSNFNFRGFLCTWKLLV